MTVCVCVSGYTSILIYRYTVYVFVCVCVKIKIKQKTTSISTDWGSFLSQCQLQYLALLLKLKVRCSANFLAFIQPVVVYMAVIFSAHLVTVKWEVFTTTTSTREIQLCAWPATQLTHSPLLLANHTCQSIVHARRFK